MRLSADEILLGKVLLLMLQIFACQGAFLLIGKSHLGVLLLTRHTLLNDVSNCHGLLRYVLMLEVLKRLIQALDLLCFNLWYDIDRV